MNGKEKFFSDLEIFVTERLRRYSDAYKENEEELELNAQERLHKMKIRGTKYIVLKNDCRQNFYYSSQLTNHEICHELFWNALRGRSRLFIQVPNLTMESGRKNEEDEKPMRKREG